MEPKFLLDGNLVWANDKKYLHRSDGPAVISPEGLEKYYIEGRELNKEDTDIAKGILDGRLLHRVPVLLNHPTFKYFCETALNPKKLNKKQVKTVLSNGTVLSTEYLG